MSEKVPDLKVLAEGAGWIAIDKRAGLHVHPPENPNYPCRRDQTVLYRLKWQTGRYVYPVHRLDCSTSGVLVVAFDSTTASHLSKQFMERQVRKDYLCVVRGWIPEKLSLSQPLESDASGDLLESLTEVERLTQIEIPAQVGKRYASSRYSLVRAFPHTGRYHQIRRHLARSSHPVIGDREHGDSKHNRYFKETLGLPRLLLRCDRLSFCDPQSGEMICIEAEPSREWRKVFALFQYST